VPVLVAIVPHPDDEAYAFAGTIALAARAGWRCIVHCASSGERGKRHDGGPADARTVAMVREAELAASCRILGAEAPYFWRLPDGGLASCRDQRTRVTALLARGIDVVLAPGADGAYGHPDHLAVHRWVAGGWAALPGHRPALLFAAFPRGLFLPQYEKCLAMMGDPPEPAAATIGADRWDLEVDVSGVVAMKLASVAAHRSQLPGGDPHALFPPGVLAGCLGVERYTLAEGSPSPQAAFFGAPGRGT
jgi:N-acetyl-1-D-myo-inositol-2-amino-2-deoxy-alpha-D-glucopyranoside deacetylase